MIRSIERQKGRIRLCLRLLFMGADVCLVLTGGERPHLGAVAVAQARESLAAPGKLSATVSNITLPGHKDDDLARDIAKRFSASTATQVAVCCRIHLDGLLPDELEDIIAMSNDMLEEMINWVIKRSRPVS